MKELGEGGGSGSLEAAGEVDLVVFCEDCIDSAASLELDGTVNTAPCPRSSWVLASWAFFMRVCCRLSWVRGLASRRDELWKPV